MKRFFLSVILVFICFIVAFSVSGKISTQAQKTENRLRYCLLLCREEREAELRASIDKIINEWEKDKRLMGFLVHKEDIDNFDNELRNLSAEADSENISECERTIAFCIEEIKRLYKEERLSAENIF